MKNIMRESIIGAFLLLIHQKELDKITVTDITRCAGISRMSFYRNYKGIDEVIYDAIGKLFERFLDELEGDILIDPVQFTEAYFEKLKENRRLAEAAKKFGSSEKIFQIILKYNRVLMEKYLGRAELTPDELLFLHYHSGGMYELIDFCSKTDGNISISKISGFVKNICSFQDKI